MEGQTLGCCVGQLHPPSAARKARNPQQGSVRGPLRVPPGPRSSVTGSSVKGPVHGGLRYSCSVFTISAFPGLGFWLPRPGLGCLGRDTRGDHTSPFSWEGTLQASPKIMGGLPLPGTLPCTCPLPSDLTSQPPRLTPPPGFLKSLFRSLSVAQIRGGRPFPSLSGTLPIADGTQLSAPPAPPSPFCILSIAFGQNYHLPRLP